MTIKVEKKTEINRLADMLSGKFPDALSRLKTDENMSFHCTFKTGGPADLYFSVACKEELAFAAKSARTAGIPVTVLGNGSNILVSDKGIRGLVISAGKNMAEMTIENETYLSAQAGALISSAAKFAAANELSGLEFAAGIPGTVGGAVFMNAGAYEGCISEVLAYSEGFDPNEGKSIMLKGKSEHDFAYRKSFYSQTGCVVLKTVFSLKKGDPEDIKARMIDFSNRRKRSQPLDIPSAGSVFKRPEGYYAGKLIEDSGLKGVRIGGASVSRKHAGFIVNDNNASSEDIRLLIEHVRKTVKDKFGVMLEPEIKMIGEW